MTEPLAAYMQDHLAGASFAIDLLESLRDQHSADALGEFAAELLPEIEAETGFLTRLYGLADSGWVQPAAPETPCCIATWSWTMSR